MGGGVTSRTGEMGLARHTTRSPGQLGAKPRWWGGVMVKKGGGSGGNND
ncbi:hypothetical protein ACQ86N_32610 [Puia sp. P3]